MLSPRLLLLAISSLVSLSATASALDVEEARLDAARAAIPLSVDRYKGLLDDLGAKFSQQTDELEMTQAVAHQGLRLWQQAVRDVQSGNLDDRALYWNRLAMRSHLKSQQPKFTLAPWQRDIVIGAVEKSSRGFSDILFSNQVQIKILLTGFDPFFLDRDIAQSNPSGLVALALDGYRFSVNGKQAQIETVMIPVRFSDFDNGIIESLLTPIYRDNTVDMIFTVSMGGDDFDLERFPGRNRSATAPDNRNSLTGASATRPIAPMLNNKTLNGPEFVEFSLPAKAMQTVQGRWKVNDNHTVTSQAKGSFSPSSIAELANEIAIEGSGGGYLSNEISYRAVLLKQQFNRSLPVGHIHTPKIKGHDADTEAAILEQTMKMIEAAAATL